jgi:glycosyltransferase involved in cell wall biosynthesis
MKILFLQDTDWIKRNPHQQVHLAERMVQKGHEVRVIDYEILWKEDKNRKILSRKKIHSVSKVFPDVKINIIRPPILKIPLFDYISMIFTYSKEINNQIKEFKPDIILSMDILISFIANPIARKNGIPIAYYAIDIDYRLIPYRFLQFIGKKIEKWNIQHADIVLSINEGLREYTIRMGAKPEKTMLIRSGFDSQMFHPQIKGNGIREKYGIKKTDTLLFFMGWLYNFSGLKEVALELSNVKNDDIKFLIVGDGDAYHDLKKIQEDLHLENKMILTGKQPYELIPEFLAAADICLIPAYNNEIMKDIVPIKTYEYMAMEKPIVTTKLQGMMKEFGNENGVIYADESSDVLNKSISLIVNGKIAEEGKKARNFVKYLDWNNITNKFEQVLSGLI